MNIEKMTILTPTPTGYLVDPERPVVSAAVELKEAHRVAAHCHPRGQLVYAIGGVVRVVSSAGAWVVPPNQAVWVAPHVEHEILAPAPVSLRLLFIDPSIAFELSTQCHVINVPPLLRELILKAVQAGNEYQAGGAVSRLMGVIIDQLLEQRPAPLHLPMARDKRLLPIIEGLMAEPSDRRGLDAWAATTGASARTLGRLFVKETGMTFSGWRTQLRLLEAIGRLGQGQTVTAVALELGYDSTSAFIAMFRKALGCPPGRYFRSG